MGVKAAWLLLLDGSVNAVVFRWRPLLISGCRHRSPGRDRLQRAMRTRSPEAPAVLPVLLSPENAPGDAQMAVMGGVVLGLQWRLRDMDRGVGLARGDDPWCDL